VAQEANPTPVPASKPAEPSQKYVRVTRDEQKQPIALETSVVSFKLREKEREGIQVDLIGAVHVADKSYYDTLNKQFEQYDALLFELVAPKDAKPGKDRPARGGSAVGTMQVGMTEVLDLAFQLDCIDYTKPNFVHADMSPEEFSASMEKRGESFMKMYFRAMGYGMARQDKGLKIETNLLFSLFSKNRAQKMKLIMADQMEDMEGQVAALEGPEGSTILTERNRKALEVLDRELKAGKKKIGIFYGAAHLADMETRLRDEFKFERTSENWLPAWNLQEKK
jgi:hypothetical protein